MEHQAAPIPGQLIRILTGVGQTQPLHRGQQIGDRQPIDDGPAHCPQPAAHGGFDPGRQGLGLRARHDRDEPVRQRGGPLIRAADRLVHGARDAVLEQHGVQSGKANERVADSSA